MTTETYRAALEAIAAMDPQAQRADDLGRAARIAASALASAPAQPVATAADRSMPQLSTNDVLHLLNLQVAELLRLFKSIPSNAPLSAKPDIQAWAEPVAPAGHDPVVWTPDDEARLDAALAERTRRREAKAQASRAAESLMDLVGQYWDLAHEEGRTGQSLGTEAGRVLGELRAMAVSLADAPRHRALSEQRMPLTEEQIFKAAESTLPEHAHRLIHETSPEYGAMCGLEPGTRWICSNVHPEHSLAFARAIEAAHGISNTGDNHDA